MFWWFQPRAHEKTSDEQQGANERSADPHTIGKTYAPVKQVVQHDRVYDGSNGGPACNEAHCKRAALLEIVRYHRH